MEKPENAVKGQASLEPGGPGQCPARAAVYPGPERKQVVVMRKLIGWKNGLMTKLMLLAAAMTSLIPLVPASPALASEPTTSVMITRYDTDGETVIDQVTITWEEMRDYLPVYGDGITHYYFQGPTFDEDNLWDSGISPEPSPGETINVDTRDFGAAQGTDVKDLCELVGGAEVGDVIKIKSPDGFSKSFDYEDVYEPGPPAAPRRATAVTSGTAIITPVCACSSSPRRPMSTANTSSDSGTCTRHLTNHVGTTTTMAPKCGLRAADSQ